MSFEIKVSILVIVSIVLAILTRRSLKSFYTHGLFRLIAWISFISLILLNIDYWFDDPYCLRQMVSWLFFAISIFVVIYGVISLREGNENKRREDPSLYGIEKTTKLVMTGAYRYIRHPMYCSFLFGAWGVFFKHYSIYSIILTVITSALAIITAKKEEVENAEYFGDLYRDYMNKTKMFIPYIF